MNSPEEIDTLIRARYPILYIVSSEELRVQRMILKIAQASEKKVFEWSCSSGILPAGTSVQSQRLRNPATREPVAALDYVMEHIEPAIFIFKDFHPFLARGNTTVVRKLKEIGL